MTTLPDQIAREVLEGHAAAYFALAPSQHEAREKVVARAAYIVSRHLDKLQERLAGAHQRAKEAECATYKELALNADALRHAKEAELNQLNGVLIRDLQSCQEENQSLRQRVEKLRGFERVVEDLHCQIDESWPNLKAASGAIQDKIREVESAFASAQADSRRLREWLERIRVMCSEDYNERDPFDRIAPACMEALK